MAIAARATAVYQPKACGIPFSDPVGSANFAPVVREGELGAHQERERAAEQDKKTNAAAVYQTPTYASSAARPWAVRLHHR